MKRTGSLIPLSLVAVLVGTSAPAQTHSAARTYPVVPQPAAAHTPSTRGIPPARGVAPAVANVAQRNALGNVSAGASGAASSASRHRGAPLNPVLGGPASFDARRLVRR
jgi:hypothetical protein